MRRSWVTAREKLGFFFDWRWRSLKSLVVMSSHRTSRHSFSNEASEQMSWRVFRFAVLLLPGDAPQGLNALDCGIFYVFKGQAARNSGPVDGQADLHWPGARHWWRGEAHDLWCCSPGGDTRKGILFCVLSLHPVVTSYLLQVKPLIASPQYCTTIRRQFVRCLI